MTRFRVFAGIIFGVVALDVVTKQVAEWYLPPSVPQPVLGLDWLRLTLVYNRGAAFGIHLGNLALTRLVFILLTFVALFILWRLFRQTALQDRWRALSIALVFGGAVGNLIDRIASSRGVVDFLDVGVGATRWPTFNVADMAVTTGAVLLARALWREEKLAPGGVAAVESVGGELPEKSGGHLS